MLNDTERKTLRVLVAYRDKHKRTPTAAQLSRLAGRVPGKVMQALRGLSQQGYVEWSPDRPDVIVILREWEIGRGPVAEPKKSEATVFDYDGYWGGR